MPSIELLENFYRRALVAYRPQAERLLQQVPKEPDRYYEGFYTFEPDVAYQVVTLMHQIYPDQVPEAVSLEDFPRV